MNHGLDTLARLVDTIASRKGAPPETSYTASLLTKGAEACAKKFGEEAFEAAMAAAKGDGPHLAKEAADVLYHLAVLLAAAEVPVADVMAELEMRTRRSGHEEKASRP